MDTKLFSSKKKYFAVKAGITHVILFYIIVLFFGVGLFGRYHEVVPFFAWDLFTGTSKQQNHAGVKVYEINGQKVEPFYVFDPKHSHKFNLNAGVMKLMVGTAIQCRFANKETLPEKKLEKQAKCRESNKQIYDKLFGNYENVSYQLIIQLFDVMERYQLEDSERYKPDAFLDEEVVFDSKLEGVTP